MEPPEDLPPLGTLVPYVEGPLGVAVGSILYEHRYADDLSCRSTTLCWRVIEPSPEESRTLKPRKLFLRLECIATGSP